MAESESAKTHDCSQGLKKLHLRSPEDEASGRRHEESDAQQHAAAGGIDRAQDMGTGVHGGGQGGENGGSTYSRGSPGSRTSSSGGGVKPADFDWGEILGEGSYSTVRKATRRSNGDVFAIKVVEKNHVIRQKKEKYVKMEKDTLNRCAHPHVVHLFCTFQDETRLFFVMELCEKELFQLLRELGTFATPCARFFMAEIVTALRFIHGKGVMHRDLKPENILLNSKGHLKITDFGTSKFIQEGKRSNSFVGTAEYVSPEVLENLGAVPASDLWALGCILFQFFAGTVPFRGASEYLTFQEILALAYTFPDTFPRAARELVERLLLVDPAARLGAVADGFTCSESFEALCSHTFFEGIQWLDPPLHQQTPPPLEPHVVKTVAQKKQKKRFELADDTCAFDADFGNPLSKSTDFEGVGDVSEGGPINDPKSADFEGEGGNVK